jgi:hypothetical protein
MCDRQAEGDSRGDPPGAVGRGNGRDSEHAGVLLATLEGEEQEEADEDAGNVTE